ncbi:MAG: DUF2442 domain-containing protein [Tannerella sp.]|nr:DUF2442 domain-containing protein [Tannerella sp.]
MNPRVLKVKPEDGYTLRVWFMNGKAGIFDVKPYLNCEVFLPLKDPFVFKSVTSVSGYCTMEKRSRPLSGYDIS